MIEDQTDPVDDDDIMGDIWRFREEYARSFNYDIGAMMEDLRASQEASGWPIVRLADRQVAAADEPPAEPVETDAP